MTQTATVPENSVNTTNNFDSFNTHFKELFDTLQDMRKQPTAGSNKDSVLIRALAALSEANNIMAEQNNRINLLQSLALTDELTGLLNRRGFNGEITKELQRVSRNHSKGGILIAMDLDGFKQINDQHGHAAGDACLAAVAAYLQKATRRTDIVSRIGGDEFLIVLTNIDEEMAPRRAEQIMKNLNWLSFDWHDLRLVASASYGAVPYGRTTNDIDQLLNNADQALYQMKQQHKAQTVVEKTA